MTRLLPVSTSIGTVMPLISMFTVTAANRTDTLYSYYGWRCPEPTDSWQTPCQTLKLSAAHPWAHLSSGSLSHSGDFCRTQCSSLCFFSAPHMNDMRQRRGEIFDCNYEIHYTSPTTSSEKYKLICFQNTCLRFAEPCYWNLYDSIAVGLQLLQNCFILLLLLCSLWNRFKIEPLLPK